jgi:hypothetical protein
VLEPFPDEERQSKPPNWPDKGLSKRDWRYEIQNGDWEVYDPEWQVGKLPERVMRSVGVDEMEYIETETSQNDAKYQQAERQILLIAFCCWFWVIEDGHFRSLTKEANRAPPAPRR